MFGRVFLSLALLAAAECDDAAVTVREGGLTPAAALPPCAEPFCMVRINETARFRPDDMKEVLRINAARPGSADGYWFALPMWNNLPETRKAMEAYKPLHRRCDELGITFDVQVVTLGHGAVRAEKATAPHGLHPFPDDAWQVDPDGRRLNMLCPRAPATQAYVKSYFAMLGETLKPNTVWLDDDLRLGFGHEDGCFCDSCLKAFNKCYGHAFTRAELAERLFKGAEREIVRREWLRFISDSLAAYGAAARAGVDRTHPSCKLGYQSVSSASLRATGQDANALLSALAGGGRVPTAIRIGSGCYGENLSEIVAKMLDIAREVERCRASGVPFAQICNEQENYQREILHKSAEATMVESALALAVGCDSLAEYRWGSRGEPMTDYAEFAAKTAAWRPYLKRVAAFSRGTALGGVARFVGSDYDLTRRFSVIDDNDAHISGLGVPLTVRESGTRCFYVDELTMEEWGADDARKLLADGGSAVVSTNAWDALLAKGGEPLRKAARDGRIVKLDFSVLRPRNWALLPNTAERKTLLDALDRATGGAFPVRIERSHRFYVYPRVRRADGKVAAVTFYNGSTGASPATEVSVRRPAGAYPVMALPEQSDLPLYVTQMTKGEIRFVIPSLGGRQVGTVIFGEACPDTAADVVRVEGERAVLPRYRDGGWWDAGYRLAALKMWEVAACGALITNSVKVVAADGRELVAGKDFKVQPDWSAVGLCGAAVSNANPVTVSYAYRAERLDGWFENAEGVIDVRRGVPAAFNPRPAAIPAGARRLANCWVRGAGRHDNGCFFRCEGAFAPPRPVVPAEVACPKTLAKLRAGGRVRILAWGDSVTDASYLPDDERWQGQLAERLRAMYPKARIEMVSQGWGGRRITSFLETPEGHEHGYTNKVLNSWADLVISEFVNDSWFTAADVSNHYGRVLADFRSRGIEWICLTPHYMMPQWNGLRGCAESDNDPRAYVKALREFAAANGVGLADAAARWGHLWREGVPYVTRFVNGVNHPDREGMSYFADAVCELLRGGSPAAPRYGWRGYMLDTSRHFFTVGEIKRALDAMQEVGLNVFHWHLTDSEGWRLEIERYPKLTSVGSVRRNGPRGSTMGDETVMGEYGPYFYTKAQVREIVAYAAARGIRVVPELDIPGHSAAAIRAYPELGCRGQGNNGELCLGRDATLETFENILREVMELFPGEVIHLGGDECSRRNWRKCPDCQARIRALGLRGEKGLQGWATARFARFLERNGRRMAGWDEIAEFDDMPRSAIVTAYRSSARGIDAAKKGFDVVFCPCEFCYLDYVQGLEGDPYEYQPFGCVLSAMKIAGFDPAAGCPAAARRHILGGQGNLWTELVCDWAGAEWRTWPRLAAIADVLANGPEKDAAAFAARLEKVRTKLKAKGVNVAPIGPLFKERPDLEPGSRYTVFRPDFAKLLPTELSVASLCFDWNDGADAFRKVYARKDMSIPSGGYRLDLDWCRIEAEASDAAGFTNAVRQLRALARMKRGGAMEFPACRIENGDIPRRMLPVERMTGLRVFTNSVGKVMAYRWSAPRHPQLGLCYPMTVLMPGEGQMARAAEILNDQREKGVDAYFIAPLPGSPTEPLTELLERMKWEDRTLDAERIRIVRP